MSQTGAEPAAIIIQAVRPDTPEASVLIAELEAHLEQFYPAESRHGYSVEKLLAAGVTIQLHPLAPISQTLSACSTKKNWIEDFTSCLQRLETAFTVERYHEHNKPNDLAIFSHGV